jgi:hypothetical protein
VIQPDGTSRSVVSGERLWHRSSRNLNEAYLRLAGLSASKARTAIVELSGASGELKEPRSIATRGALKRDARRDRDEPPVVHQDD